MGETVVGVHRYSEKQCFQLIYRNRAETVPETVRAVSHSNGCHVIVTAARALEGAQMWTAVGERREDSDDSADEHDEDEAAGALSEAQILLLMA